MLPTGYTPRRITRTEKAPSRYWFIAAFVLYCAIEYFYPSL
jgi:hypothetical protein